MKPPTHISFWQTTHKQLLRDDAQYRRRFRSYLITLLCLCFLLLPFYLPFFGIPLFGFPGNLCLILTLAALIVLLTFRQFHFQNQTIRRFSENGSRTEQMRTE